MTAREKTARPALGRAVRVVTDRLADEWHYLRMWMARGNAGSKWWVPAVGDRVKHHGKGHWLVYGTSIRRGEVELGRPGMVALEHVEPIPPGELAALHDRWGEARRAGRVPVLEPVRPVERPSPPPPPDSGKATDLTDYSVFTVDGEVVDGPEESEESDAG